MKKETDDSKATGFNTVSSISLELSSGEELSACSRCRVICGIENVFVSVIILIIGGFMFYISAFNPVSAVFIILGSIAICLLGAIIFQVMKAVFVLGKKIDNVTGDQTEQTGEAKGVVCCCYDFYMNVFDINGKFYLVKMYASELFEHTTQAYLLQSYLCIMPIEATTLFCFVLVTELSFNLWVTFYLRT